MGYGNLISLDVYTIGRREKVCNLYTSGYEQPGSAHSIKRTRQLNGWKEISFTIPVRVNGEINWRTDFITNEYELRVTDGDETDWYRLSEPTDSGDGLKSEIQVDCPHCSVLLKKRNIYLSFDDTNGVGTQRELMTRALDGTGWTQGLCDTIYEADGVTEKIRSYSCNEKTGAYQMTQDICDKFVAYPIFHGDTQTVDVHARTDHEGMLEMRLEKNLAKISRTRDSSDIITRLYVEGEYGDLGYIGIDDVNPTGLNFITNFDYYREIGALTQEQDDAITAYLTQTATARSEIMTQTALNETAITTMQQNWGTQGYVIYPVDGAYFDPAIYGNGANSDNDMAVGDEVMKVSSQGAYEYYTVQAIAPPADAAYVIKFVTPCGGAFGGKDVAIIAKRESIATLTELMDNAETEQEAQSYQDQIDAELATIDEIYATAEPLLLDTIALARGIDTRTKNIETLIGNLTTLEDTFVSTLGDMLQDGYYSDATYGPGQEQALYNDAVEMMKTLSRPQNTYELSEKDLANVEGYEDEIFTMNMAVHFYNGELNINDYGFVEEITEYLDRPNTRSVEVKTDEMNIQGKSFSSFLNRITDAAQIVKDQQTIFERAKALNADGSLGAGKLEGMIDVFKNRLVSSMSNWYTDDNGNIMFVSADESNAMMLCGNGFMVANGKDAHGNWNWRTFGTGEGFTADLITAGILRAGIITILGSDQFYWTGDNLYVLDPQDDDRQIRIGRYDGVNLGIAYTTDGGTTWQTAIGFDGVHLSASDRQILENSGRGGRNYIEQSLSILEATVVV